MSFITKTFPLFQRLRWWVEFGVVWLVLAKFRLLPSSWARWGGELLGLLVWVLVSSRRRVCQRNLQRAFPELSLDQVNRLSRRVFRHFGRWAVELARMPGMSEKEWDRLMTVTGWSNLEKAFSQGRGVIFVSGHIGNWEWLGGIAAKRGFPVAYVVEHQANPYLERLLDHFRRHQGVKIIPRERASREILHYLRQGYIIAMLSDQDAGDVGVQVPFFGINASTPRGPAIFHLKTRAPLIFGYLVKEGKRYIGGFEEPMEIAISGHRESDERTIMAVITSQLEALVRRYPDQYLWLHRRWKSTADLGLG